MSPETQRQKKRAEQHKPPRRVRPPSRDQVEELIWAMPCLVSRSMVAVAAWSGLRRFEVCELEWERIRFKGATAEIYVPHGKGMKERTSVLLEPGVRWLPPVQEEGWVYPSPYQPKWLRGEQRSLSPSWMTTKFAKHKPRHLRHHVFHDLRKFHATWLLDQGYSTEDVAVQLGHFHANGYPNIMLVRERYGFPTVRRSLERVAQADTSDG